MYKPGVITRRMTGIGLGVLFILVWLLQGWPMRVVLALFGVIGVLEVYAALEHRGSKPVKWVGVGFMALCLPVCHFGGLTGMFLLCALSVAVGLCAVMIKGDIESDALFSTLFPIFYPGILFGLLIAPTYIASPVQARLISGLTYYTASFNDIAAYEIGSLYGKRLLAPKLSPKKTVEGSLAGLAGSVLTAVLVPLLMKLACDLVPAWQQYAAGFPAMWVCVLFGLVAGVAAQFGDLCASTIKRYCGVKDYGTIFPGHGGVMDRMDSHLFNGVCAAVFMVLFAMV